MSTQDWGFSSSSEDDWDDERPTTKLKTNTNFYQNFQNGEFGADWPRDLTESTAKDHQNHITQAAVPCVSAQNGHAIDLNCTPNNFHGTSVLSSSAILATTPENIVLIDEGQGQYRPVRVISHRNLLTPRKTPEVKPPVS